VQEQRKDPFQQVSAEGDLGLTKETPGCSRNHQLPGCQKQGSRGSRRAAPDPGIRHLAGDGESCSVLE